MLRKIALVDLPLWCLLALLSVPYVANAQCVSSITPTERTHGQVAESGTVVVTASSECAWTATSNATWIVVTAGSSGTGNGAVSYSVEANTGASLRIGTLTIEGSVFSVTQAAPAVPAILSLSPFSQTVGGPPFNLTVIGTNFSVGCDVSWNGAIRPTTFISTEQLRASILGADIAIAGSANVTVSCPTGGTSSARTFPIVPTTNPVPMLDTISPFLVFVASDAQTISLVGERFVPTSTVRWNETNLATIYETGSLLTATLPASYRAAPGIALVTVVNPAPGGGASAAQLFRIVNPDPDNTNVAPVANAGPDQTVRLNTLATLDGSDSHDPNAGDQVFYQWTLTVRPGASTVALSNPLTMRPSFTPDVTGDYLVTLQIVDNHGEISPADTVTISTVNAAPTADAGVDQSVAAGRTAFLDGSQSWDPDGDALTYRWNFVSRPAGSSTSLTGADTATPSFYLDAAGDFVVQLLVFDPWGPSAADLVTVSSRNVPPVADAGQSRSTVVFSPVTLDGTASSDANGDPLTYTWTLLSAPTGSLAVVMNASTVRPSITADVPGTFVVQLVVSDGREASEPSTVQVQAASLASAAGQAVQQAQADVAALNRLVFKNGNMQNALLNKLNAVIASVETGRYADALEQLENDILGKTNGCAIALAPDRNDWILDCVAQQQIREDILLAALLIRELM